MSVMMLNKATIGVVLSYLHRSMGCDSHLNIHHASGLSAAFGGHGYGTSPYSEYDVDGESFVPAERSLERFGRKMHRLNARAYATRYREEYEVPEFNWQPIPFAPRITPTNALKQLDCIRYQCNEEQTNSDPTFKLMTELCGIIAGHIARSSEAYDTAKWGEA